MLQTRSDLRTKQITRFGFSRDESSLLTPRMQKQLSIRACSCTTLAAMKLRQQRAMRFRRNNNNDEMQLQESSERDARANCATRICVGDFYFRCARSAIC